MERSKISSEGFKGGWIELAQGATQAIDKALAGPHQILVLAGQDLDGFRQIRVAGERSMVVPIGAHQVCHHLRLAPTPLPPPVPVPPPTPTPPPPLPSTNL